MPPGYMSVLCVEKLSETVCGLLLEGIEQLGTFYSLNLLTYMTLSYHLYTFISDAPTSLTFLYIFTCVNLLEILCHGDIV